MTPRTEEQHEELRSLLGAYVLNAVDEIEHRRVERHLRTCEACASEARLLGAPVGELALLPELPDDADELIEKITAALPWRPRKVLMRLSAGIAAVAVAAAGFLGLALRDERARQDRIATVIAGAERSVAFDGQGGFDGTGRLYLAGGQAVLALDDMPAPGQERAWQLWALTSGEPTSMSVIEGEDRIVHLFEWEGRATAFAVTIEPAGGSPVPTSDPVLISS